MIIQSVHRALTILKLFSPRRPQLGITEIADLMGLHKATAQGLVRTLTAERFLKKNPSSNKYELGFAIYELGVSLASSLEINQRATGPAHRLALATKRLVRVSILDQDSAIIVLDAYPRSTPFLYQQFGLRFPLYCTAMGKVMLAFMMDETELEQYCDTTDFVAYTPNSKINKEDLLSDIKQIRADGYSTNNEEHWQSRAAIAVPVYDRRGQAIASICIVGEPNQVRGDKMPGLVQHLKAAAAEISGSLGYIPDPGMPGDYEPKTQTN